jgi:hypothetical protein
MPDSLNGGAETPPHFVLSPKRTSKRNPVADEKIKANVRYALSKGYQQLGSVADSVDEPVAIVGGGPSLKHTLPLLKEYYAAGMKIVAAGSAHDWCVKNGIIPWAAVCIDPLPEMAKHYNRPQKKTRYLISATCDPAVFKRLRKYQVYTWFPDIGVDLSFAKPVMLVLGGCTVVLRAIHLLYAQGFRAFHFFGFDGCVDPDTEEHHAYDATPDGENQVFKLGERIFKVPGPLISQFWDFDDLLAHHADKFDLAIHGDGLMAHLMRERARQGI